jgi:uncharacterized membrane protein YagU involved in acid resistance
MRALWCIHVKPVAHIVAAAYLRLLLLLTWAFRIATYLSQPVASQYRVFSYSSTSNVAKALQNVPEVFGRWAWEVSLKICRKHIVNQQHKWAPLGLV